MNTAMWARGVKKSPKGKTFLNIFSTPPQNHPVTPEQIDRIRYWGYKVIDPISKTLMCGEKESKETSVFSDNLQWRSMRRPFKFETN